MQERRLRAAIATARVALENRLPDIVPQRQLALLETLDRAEKALRVTVDADREPRRALLFKMYADQIFARVQRGIIVQFGLDKVEETLSVSVDVVR